MNKWERNLQKVRKAQERARKKISELEAEGYEVRSYLKELVDRPLKTRYTDKQVQTYLALTHSNRIKAAAKSASGIRASQSKNVTRIPQLQLQKHLNIAMPRQSEIVDVRKGHEAHDLAKAYYKHMKFAMNQHPSQEADLILWRTFKMLKSVGLTSKSVRLRQGELQKYINSISEKDFISAFVKYTELSPQAEQDINTIRKIFYGLGRSSERMYEQYRDIAFEQAKLTFGSNFNIDRDKIDKLYEFFSKSNAWNTFRKQYFDSDQADAEEVLEELADAATKYSFGQLDSLITQSYGVDDLLAKIKI